MKKGFTLIELLVVVLIIGVLSAVALPQYQTAVERARATEALTMVSAISESAQRYHSQHEQWPSTDNSFNQLDIDVPMIDSSTYGGKHFTVIGSVCEGEVTTNTYCVQANRRRNNHYYNILAITTANANGTYSVVRSCNPQENDSEALSYCNAITGGNNTSF